MTCDRCLGDAAHGEHGLFKCPLEVRSRANYIESVTWPGGRVFENMGHTPVRCDSPADYKREIKARGLEQRVRHVPMPGSDRSPHTSDWSKGSIDATTLANAAALVARQGQASKEPEPQTYIQSLTTTTSYSEDTVRLR